MLDAYLRLVAPAVFLAAVHLAAQSTSTATYHFPSDPPAGPVNGFVYSVVHQPDPANKPYPVGNGVTQGGGYNTSKFTIRLTVDPCDIRGHSDCHQHFYPNGDVKADYQDVDSGTYRLTFTPAQASGLCNPKAGGVGSFDGDVTAKIFTDADLAFPVFHKASAVAAAAMQIEIDGPGGGDTAQHANSAAKECESGQLSASIGLSAGWLSAGLSLNTTTGWSPYVNTKEVKDDCEVRAEGDSSGGATIKVKFWSEGFVDIMADYDSLHSINGTVEADTWHDVPGYAILQLHAETCTSGDENDTEVEFR